MNDARESLPEPELHQAAPRPDKAELLREIDAIRASLKVPPLTADRLREAKEEGRP